MLQNIYSFRNDYSELAHPRVLEALKRVENSQFAGYGKDEYTLRAASLIKEKIKKTDADVHFISGGTHANLTVISALLRPYEAVIACEGGHIATHETGAIEATGHKICAVTSSGGKLSVRSIDEVVKSHTDEHMVKPKAVFISQATEVGTVYTKKELIEVSDYCKCNNLYLYLDGARIATGVNSSYCDMTYVDIANLVDVFYFGGTKNGALFGEAIVILNEKVKENFRYFLKQKGGLLAKGAALGIQFEELFKDNLYDALAIHSNSMASKLAKGIRDLGYEFLTEAQSNQIFPIFSNDLIQEIKSSYEFHEWQKIDNTKTAIRLVTSWSTPIAVIDNFLECLSLK